MSRVRFLVASAHMSSPSTGRKWLASAQDVHLSDVATWMSHRNDSYFLKRGGNTNELGDFDVQDVRMQWSTWMYVNCLLLTFLWAKHKITGVILHSAAARRVSAMDGASE